jgi:hypothetical protein
LAASLAYLLRKETENIQPDGAFISHPLLLTNTAM